MRIENMANEETNGGNLMKAAELLDAAGNIVAGTHQGMAAQIKELESFKERPKRLPRSGPRPWLALMRRSRRLVP
jgi:hypothetical protein